MRDERQHAPGSWVLMNDPRVSGDGEIHVAEVVGESGEYRVPFAVLDYQGPESLRKACVIAAAPEMLEALRTIKAMSASSSAEYRIAKTAIAKATEVPCA